MQLPHRKVDSGLGDAVWHHGHRRIRFQLTVRAHARGDGEEFRVAGLFEEGLRGTEEEDGAECVDDERVEEVLFRCRCRGTVAAENARIGDDDVEVGNVVGRLKRRDGGLCGLRDGGVVWEDDEFTVFAFREGGEGLRSRMAGVPDKGNGGGRGAGKVDGQEGFADAPV